MQNLIICSALQDSELPLNVFGIKVIFYCLNKADSGSGSFIREIKS